MEDDAGMMRHKDQLVGEEESLVDDSTPLVRETEAAVTWPTRKYEGVLCVCVCA